MNPWNMRAPLQRKRGITSHILTWWGHLLISHDWNIFICLLKLPFHSFNPIFCAGAVGATEAFSPFILVYGIAMVPWQRRKFQMLERDFETLYLPSAFQSSSHGRPPPSSYCKRFEARFCPLPSTCVENDECLYLPVSTHSSTLAWKIPWTEECGRLQSMGSQRVGHAWATSLMNR